VGDDGVLPITLGSRDFFWLQVGAATPVAPSVSPSVSSSVALSAPGGSRS